MTDAGRPGRDTAARRSLLRRSAVLAAVSGLTIAACGDDTASTASSVSFDATAWQAAHTEGAAFGTTISDLPDLSSLWNDLFSRLDSVRATIADGSTTAEDLRDWRAFDADVIELGKAIERDRDQLAPDVVEAWGRFAAAIDVVDREVER